MNNREIRVFAGFCEVLVGASVEEARAYLERRNWNINLAVDSFLVERRPPPSQKKSNPLRLVSKPQFQDYSKPLKIGSSSFEYGLVSYYVLRVFLSDSISIMMNFLI